MKQLLRKLFSPILKPFESGEGQYAYKPLNRKILIAMGVLCSGLGSVVGYLALNSGDLGFLLPVVVFGGGGLLCLVIGFLGNERAVAKIWGNK